MDVRKLELEDLYIIEEKPLKVRIGTKYLLIKPLALRDADKFETMFAGLLIKWSTYLSNISILDYTGLSDTKKVGTFSFLWKRLLKKDKRFLVDMCKLICKPYKFPVHYFRKHATYATVTQCYLATQLLNYDAVKKNITYLFQRANIVQQSSTLLSTSQKTSGGAKTIRLVPRY